MNEGAPNIVFDDWLIAWDCRRTRRCLCSTRSTGGHGLDEYVTTGSSSAASSGTSATIPTLLHAARASGSTASTTSRWIIMVDILGINPSTGLIEPNSQLSVLGVRRVFQDDRDPAQRDAQPRLVRVGMLAD